MKKLEQILMNKEDRNKIVKLFSREDKNDALYSLINFFLEKIIKDLDTIPIESPSLKNAFEILKNQMRNHKILTPKMIEFYICYRLKELHLSSICQNVIVTLDNHRKLACYSLEGDICKNGTLKIDYEKLINGFKGNKEKKEENLNDTINISILLMLSHELKHIIDMKEYLKNTKNKENTDFINAVVTNKTVNRKIRNMHLRKIVGEENYQRHHDIFIEEARADIFSYFDTNSQLLTRFKNCYESNDIVRKVSFLAGLLVKKYTNEERIFFSPMEQFNAFYDKNIKETDRIFIALEEETDTFTSLINGEKIPIELYEFLKQIASAEIITNDLEKTIKEFIATFEEKLETQGETL